jgi:hypothetical protein
MRVSMAVSSVRRRIAQTAAVIGGAAVIIACCPALGIPVALAVTAYAAIRLGSPHTILRGQTLSPDQHHRAAVIAAGAVLGVTAMFTGASSALGLAGALEHRLGDALQTAERRGETEAGQIFEACDVVCARAVILQVPTRHTPGIARLSGFTINNRAIYRWRSPPERLEVNTVQR